MEKNHILIDNVSTQNIEEIVMNLANLYDESGYTVGMQLYRKHQSTNSFLVCFTNSPDFERFCYFINYLRYPEGFDNCNPMVRGYYQTKDITNKIDFGLGTWIMVYISKEDKEYDNVTIVNSENENYLYDFGGKITRLSKMEESFELSQAEIRNYNHIIDIFPAKAFEKATKPWWKLW